MTTLSVNWTQACALRELSERRGRRRGWVYVWSTTYWPSTMDALVRRGLAEARNDGIAGSEYRITREGRAWLKANPVRFHDDP